MKFTNKINTKLENWKKFITSSLEKIVTKFEKNRFLSGFFKSFEQQRATYSVVLDDERVTQIIQKTYCYSLYGVRVVFVDHLTRKLIKWRFPRNQGRYLSNRNLCYTSDRLRVQFSYTSNLYIDILCNLNVVWEGAQERSGLRCVNCIGRVSEANISGDLVRVVGRPIHQLKFIARSVRYEHKFIIITR